jgi:hypothetical protein
MAYRGPLLYAWIKIYSSTCKEREGRQGTECGGRSEATLAIVVRRLGLCGEGVGHRLVSGVEVPSGATTFLLPFASLCSILPAFFWLSRAPFSLPLPLFLLSLHPPVAQSYLASRLKSTSLCVPVATFHIPTVLCSLTLPSNKAPSHNTDTPTSWSSKWVNSSGTNTLATLRSRPLSVCWQSVSTNCDRPNEHRYRLGGLLRACLP